LHVAVDIDTKLITYAIVTKWHANDSPFLILILYFTFSMFFKEFNLPS